MTKKDREVYDYVIKHFNELSQALNDINDEYDTFVSNIVYQKAIKMDLFQIGELFNLFSKDVKRNFNNRDIRGIIDVRNYIAHGYIALKDKTIWNDLHNDLPRLISQLKLLFE